MTILYLIPQLYNAGGMERVLCQKVNWLARHTDHRLLIATTELAPQGLPVCHFPLDERVEVKELRLDFDADFSLPLWRKLPLHMRRMRLYRAALKTLVRDEKIDLCVSLGGKEIAFLNSLSCPTIAELHFSRDQRQLLIDAYHHGAIWRLLGKIRTSMLVRDVRRLRRMVCLTEADLHDWQDAGCRNVMCIPNPCSLDTGEEMAPFSEADYLIRDRHQVIAVGRLHPQKGFDRLIEAWEQVIKVVPTARLTIYGEGESRPMLEEQVRRLGLEDYVSLPGATDRIGDCYRSASLMVLSSRYEGLPLAMIESMWSATPCVAFDCPQGPSEMIGPDRGLLVEEGNVAALAQAIVKMMESDSLRARCARRSYEYAHEHYSEQAIMQQWTDLFSRLTRR